jgi:hypothetical protein
MQMSKTVAVLQSNYIPWKGYFDIVAAVDLFVFHDDCLFTKNNWRNRNRIMTNAGPCWLSIPCGRPRERLICEVELEDASWQKRHWKTLVQEYGKAAFFPRYAPFLEEVYLGTVWKRLSDLNQHLIRHIAREFLGVTTAFDDSRSYNVPGRKAERVLNLLDAIGGVTEYLTGPAARDYLDPEPFLRRGIRLTWMDYGGYPEYRQEHSTFVDEVSILDLLFREGPRAGAFMKHVRTG